MTGHDWLTDAVAGVADTVVRLDDAVSARPGKAEIRHERKAAQRTLRMLLARAVYAEHPGWLYDRQYRLFMERERMVLAQARERLTAGVPS